MDPAASTKNGTAILFISVHPCNVNSSPDDSDVAAIVMKITRSFRP